MHRCFFSTESPSRPFPERRRGLNANARRPCSRRYTGIVARLRLAQELHRLVRPVLCFSGAANAHTSVRARRRHRNPALPNRTAPVTANSGEDRDVDGKCSDTPTAQKTTCCWATRSPHMQSGYAALVGDQNLQFTYPDLSTRSQRSGYDSTDRPVGSRRRPCDEPI